MRSKILYDCVFPLKIKTDHLEDLREKKWFKKWKGYIIVRRLHSKLKKKGTLDNRDATENQFELKSFTGQPAATHVTMRISQIHLILVSERQYKRHKKKILQKGVQIIRRPLKKHILKCLTTFYQEKTAFNCNGPNKQKLYKVVLSFLYNAVR